MAGEDRLEWVQRNRTRPDRVKQAGALMAQLAARVAVDDASSRITAVLAGVVDKEFRRHCRIGVVRSGVLRVHVDEATMVSEMRTRWLQPLSRALSVGAGIGPVNRIAFALGQAGMRVPAPDDPPVRD